MQESKSTDSTAQDLHQSIRSRQAQIVVVGLGYVGLPLAVEVAKGGFCVTGVERNAERVAQVNHGESYIADVPTTELGPLVDAAKLCAEQGFDSISRADVVVMCVPTPLDKNRNPDIQFIRNVIQNSSQYLHKGQLLILESTSYPGTLEEAILPHVNNTGLTVGEDIFVAYSSERIDPGNASYRLRNSSKVIGGVTPACTSVACAFYEAALSSKTHPVSSPRVAEMSKLLENVFRVVNVSLVNELSQLCDRMGLDIWEVIGAAETKPFGFMPFYPGPGVGGHCIPIDPFYLSWKAREYGFTPRFIELAGEINDNMPGYVVAQAMDQLNAQGKAMKGSRIMALGVAYKRDVSDTRESAALRVIELLLERGADVSYHDPFIRELQLGDTRLFSVPLKQETLESTDLVVITADHTDVDYVAVAKHAPLVYDTRNAMRDFREVHIRRLGAPATLDRATTQANRPGEATTDPTGSAKG